MTTEPTETPEDKKPPKRTAADWNQELGEIFLFFLGAAGATLFVWIVISGISWLWRHL